MEENINVVIYARYSSHNQQETSIEGQLKVCHEFCKRNGYNVINEYIDRAISGTTDNRPSFNKMIGDSRNKDFKYIVVYQLDRFARNRYHSAVYKEQLKQLGIRVLSARENITDDASGIMLECFLEAYAEYFSVELSQKVIRGMEINASKCLCTGGNRTLGFTVDKDKKFHIDPNTAPIIQCIFEMYAKGKTIPQITEHLNAQGHKTVQGCPFGKNSIRNILHNKRYIGVYTYKDQETPNGLPRIISDELFYKVQKMLVKNKKAPARSRAKEEYLLTTKLFCGHCKEMMTGFSGTSHTGKVYKYYECKGTKKGKCKKRKVRKEYIEKLVVDECLNLLTTKNINKISKEISKLCEEERDTYNLKRLKKLLTDNERKHKNLINAVADCDNDGLRKTFYDEIITLEKQRTEIEKEIRFEENAQPLLTKPEIKYFLTSLKKGNDNDINYQKALINTFVNSIYLYDDGKLTIIFNSSNNPVTVTDNLLSDIEANNKGADGLFINNVSLP